MLSVYVKYRSTCLIGKVVLIFTQSFFFFFFFFLLFFSRLGTHFSLGRSDRETRENCSAGKRHFRVRALRERV